MAGLSVPRKTRKSSSAYAPKFKNPVPLPSIDDFRLNNILTGTLMDQTQAVQQSLLNVTSNYQKDLRSEIRRALTIEQKIQFKNIQVAKLANTILRGLKQRQKRYDRLLQKSDAKGQASSTQQPSDLDKLLDLAVKTSATAQNLSVRLASLDRKSGGSGVPDAIKYPRLAKLLASMDPADVSVSQVDELDVYSASLEEPQLMEEYVGRDPVNGFTEQLSDSAVESENEILQSATASDPTTKAISPAPHAFDGNATSSSTSNGKTTNGKLNEETASELPVVSPATDIEIVEAVRDVSEEEMDAEAFEYLIDMNVLKYRQKRSQQYDELELFGPQATSNYRSLGNPLRLLYSSSNLENSDMVHGGPDELDLLHSPFVLTKSIATVSETPLTSLHKKLRINALPMKFSKLGDNACQCGPSELSSAKQALNDTLLKEAQSQSENRKQHRSASAEEEELWSSPSIQTETEDYESDPMLWSSSDPDSSSDSQTEATNETNSIYLALKKDLRSRKRHRLAKKHRRVSVRSETSPTPKHQPSHRTLKPKQSILKLRSVASNKSKVVSPPPASVDRLAHEVYLETPYRSSPRGSFVNDYSAIGVILQSGERSDGDESEEGDLEDNIVEETADATGKIDVAHEESKTVSKLRRLLI